MALIFVSHSEKDKPVVDDLFRLLQTGANVSYGDIFCTSVEGAGIETGEDFVAWIEQNIGDAEFVVLVVTPNYLASTFCIAEMGAAWALEKRVFPLVLPGMPSDLGSVMLGRQTARVNKEGLDNLYESVKDLGVKVAKVAYWNVECAKFMKLFAEKEGSLPEPDHVPREDYDLRKDEAEAAVQMSAELQKQLEQCQEKCRRLEQAKDRKEVQAIRREFSNDLKEYERLVSGACPAGPGQPRPCDADHEPAAVGPRHPGRDSVPTAHI